MEKFDKEWLRQNGIDVPDNTPPSNDGKFFLIDGDSIITVDRKAERELLETLSMITARPERKKIEVCRNASVDKPALALKAGSPMLIQNKHSNMQDLNKALDACVASYLGD